MSDRIEVRGLVVRGIHGELPSERDRPQPFGIDLELDVDLSAAGASDRLEDTVDYGEVAVRAAGVVSSTRSHRLLESLAEGVARAVLDVDARIEAVTVVLRKLQPPLDLELADVGVRITRRR
jgi:dihydroneopterin aldolase